VDSTIYACRSLGHLDCVPDDHNAVSTIFKIRCRFFYGKPLRHYTTGDFLDLIDQLFQLVFVRLAQGIVWLRPHLPVLCAAIAWAIPLMILWNLYNFLHDGVKKVQTLHQIPCAGCCYATNDYRLKCSVNPTEAFSEEAISCRDFEAATGGQDLRHV